MATPPVASSRRVPPEATDYSPARVHVWRVLSMFAALVGVVCVLVLIVTSAA